jgi:hypothetical protein
MMPASTLNAMLEKHRFTYSYAFTIRHTIHHIISHSTSHTNSIPLPLNINAAVTKDPPVSTATSDVVMLEPQCCTSIQDKIGPIQLKNMYYVLVPTNDYKHLYTHVINQV